MSSVETIQQAANIIDDMFFMTSTEPLPDPTGKLVVLKRDLLIFLDELTTHKTHVEAAYRRLLIRSETPERRRLSYEILSRKVSHFHGAFVALVRYIMDLDSEQYKLETDDLYSQWCNYKANHRVPMTARECADFEIFLQSYSVGDTSDTTMPNDAFTAKQLSVLVREASISAKRLAGDCWDYTASMLWISKV